MQTRVPFAAASSRFWFLSILLIAAAPAEAQERPASTPSPPAPAWSTYRPGTAWASGRSVTNVTTSSSGMARAAVPPTRSGWATYAPSSGWTGYRGVTTAPSTSSHVPVYVSQSGWATYAPSSAWATYRTGAGWQSYTPAAARPLNMRQAHVPGPSPYADGLAHNYYEYGTGRPVPLAKPWLPGAP